MNRPVRPFPCIAIAALLVLILGLGSCEAPMANGQAGRIGKSSGGVDQLEEMEQLLLLPAEQHSMTSSGKNVAWFAYLFIDNGRIYVIPGWIRI